MELATEALGRLLPKLGTLLAEEYKMQKGVRGEIKFLQAEMESMQAALKELSQLPAHQIGHLDKLWARDMNELSYDIEDSVDTFMVRIEDAPVGAKPHSLIRRLFDRISGSHNRLIGLLTKAKTCHHVVDHIEDINAGEKELDELIRSIREILNDKRYFIVIDDVWNEEEWKFIKCALIDKNLGCKVIVTTRNVDVANLCSVDGAMYELDPLSDADSKRLLCKRIFNEVEGMHSELEEVAKKILKKCGGVPLAIITIASMLASLPNQTKYEWYRVYNSMGSGLEKDKTLESMREILSLSYNDLPYYLKPCLLYLSMFPEDYEIPRYRLVQMWAAEDFIIEEKRRNLYEIGGRYFSELVNRSMIQPVGIDNFGSPRACRVHDMILDLIIVLSAQENFVIISEGPQLISPKCAIRRLSLQGSRVYTYEDSSEIGSDEEDSHKEDSKEEQVILPAKVNMFHVRSLIAFDYAFQWMPPLSSFSVLRVLDFACLPSKNNHPKDLGSSHHLRYLNLRGRPEAELLEEIGSLQFLKTLDLSDATMKELPSSIYRLWQLENLIIHARVKLPYGIGNLMSLQDLEWLDGEESPNTLAELGNLTQLRVLRIYGLGRINESHVKTFLISLSNLHNIRTLVVSDGESPDLDCMSDQWRGPAHLQNFDATLSRLPRWFSTLSELSCLSIMMDVLRQDGLQLLGALPVLRVLELHVDWDGITEERLVIGLDEPFRSLEEFTFTHSSRCWLVFGQGVMPRLQRLELYFRVQKREGGGFDIGLENLTSLKHVTVVVDCFNARILEVEDLETKIRDVIEIHPNHPTLELSRILEGLMAEDENKGDREAPEQQSSADEIDLLATDDESDNGSEASE